MFVTWRDYREVVHSVLFLTKNFLMMWSTGCAYPKELTVYLCGGMWCMDSRGGLGGRE